MTSSQLSEWEVYNRLEPIGAERLEGALALQSSLIMNISRMIWGKPGVEMTTADLFMPEWDKDLDEEQEPVKQSVEQQKQIWLQIAAMQNRRVKKEKEREAKLNKNPPSRRGKKK